MATKSAPVSNDSCSMARGVACPAHTLFARSRGFARIQQWIVIVGFVATIVTWTAMAIADKKEVFSRLAAVEQQTEVDRVRADKDHDMLVEVRADIRWIREAMQREGAKP